MGFLGSMLGATVKTVLTPIAVVKDVVNVVSGEEADATSEHVDSILEDVDDAISGI